MRHTVTRTAVVLLCALAATACGSNGSGSTDAKPSPSKTANPQTAYLTTAHQITFNGQPTDTELLTYPPKWCRALDDGHSVAWLFSSGGGGLYPIGPDWGTVKQDANRLLVAGVRAYCPRNTAAVTGELRETGAY